MVKSFQGNTDKTFTIALQDQQHSVNQMLANQLYRLKTSVSNIQMSRLAGVVFSIQLLSIN